MEKCGCGKWVGGGPDGVCWKCHKDKKKAEKNTPPAGTWASVAAIMAEGDDSGFDWDAWKDEMKEAA
jgi:hypothetical protein